MLVSLQSRCITLVAPPMEPISLPSVVLASIGSRSSSLKLQLTVTMLLLFQMVLNLPLNMAQLPILLQAAQLSLLKSIHHLQLLLLTAQSISALTSPKLPPTLRPSPLVPPL